MSFCTAHYEMHRRTGPCKYCEMVSKLRSAHRFIRDEVANQVCYHGNGLTPDECFIETGKRCLPCKARALLREEALSDE